MEKMQCFWPDKDIKLDVYKSIPRNTFGQIVFPPAPGPWLQPLELGSRPRLQPPGLSTSPDSSPRALTPSPGPWLHHPGPGPITQVLAPSPRPWLHHPGPGSNPRALAPALVRALASSPRTMAPAHEPWLRPPEDHTSSAPFSFLYHLKY